jgi:nitroreductase
MDVIEAILSRRSVGRLTGDEPPREVIERLLEAAVSAPNHHRTEPWRFFVLSGAARDALGEALAEALVLRMQHEVPEKVEALRQAERAKPMRAPLLVVVGVKHEPDERVVPIEDLQACSAAIQNLLLAAHGLGLAAQWRTGDGAYDALVKAHFGLEPGDEIAGIVYLGYPAEGALEQLKPRDARFAGRVEWRDGKDAG